MAWNQLQVVPAPAAGTRLPWTKAIIDNRIYLYRQGLDNVLLVNDLTPGSISLDLLSPEVDPTGVAYPDLTEGNIVGIFAARSRLGMWDSDNSILWGGVDEKLDLVPSLETRANTVKVNALKGKIVTIVEAKEGFVIYSTANIVLARYNQDSTSQNTFLFVEISENLGIYDERSVTKGPDGVQYAWTNGDLYMINEINGQVTNMFPEVGDYIKSFEQSPFLTHHLNRYLAIHLQDEKVNEARTERQLHHIDPTLYYRDRYDPDIPHDGQPVPTAPSGPIADCIDPLCDDNILWGAYIEDALILDIEERTADIDAIVPAHPLVNSNLGGGRELWLDAKGIQYRYHTWTDETRAKYAGAPIGSIPTEYLLRYSFDPMAILLYQAYLWQAEAEHNVRMSRLFNDYSIDFGTVTPLVNAIDRDRISTVLLDTTEAYTGPDLPTEVSLRSYKRPFVRAGSFTDGTSVVNEVTFVGYNTIAQIKRTLVYETYIPFEPDAEAIARAAIPGTEFVEDIAFNGFGIETTGLRYLTGEDLEWFMDDLRFESIYPYRNAEQIVQPIWMLGDQDYSNGAAVRFWGTGHTINIQTDRCSFAQATLHPSTRVTTEHVEDYEVTLGADVTWRETHTFNVETYDSDILNLPGTEIPRLAKVDVVPIARVTHTSLGSPADYLEEYYQRSVRDAVDILQVYADEGWTIESPPVNLPYTPSAYSKATSPGSLSLLNGVDATEVMTEYRNFGTFCGNRIHPTSGQQGDIEPPDVNPEKVEDVVIPGSFFLTAKGAPGPIHPIYQRTLIYDSYFQRWGTANIAHEGFIDYSPVNEVTFDPIQETGTTRFTYENFLSRLGAILPSGMLVLFDDSPEQAYIVYGKVGHRRHGFSRMQEVFAEFSERPDAHLIVEGSLAGRLIDPELVRAEPVKEAGHLFYLDVNAKWFNLVISGRFHVTGIEYLTSQPYRSNVGSFNR